MLRTFSVVLGLIVACLLVEAALWVFQIEPTRVLTKRLLVNADSKPIVSYACYPSNPNGEFREIPDTTQGNWLLISNMLPAEELPIERLPETPWCVEYRMSRLNIRDREYAAVTPPGTLRMAMFGDSFVLGEGVPIEKTLSRQTVRLLGPKYELLNMGSSGWNTHQELQSLEYYVPIVHAKRAIVVFTANDVEVTPELESRQTFINDLINIRDEHLARHEEHVWYNGHSRLLRFIGGSLEMRRIGNETIQWYKDMYDERHNKFNLVNFSRYLKRMADRTDCEVVYVLYPLMEGLEGEYPLAEVHAKVAKMAENAGLPVLDLAPAFAGQKTSDMWVHESDHHPNGKAQAIAAKALVEWLHTLPGFLDLPPEPATTAPAEQDTEPQAAADAVPAVEP